MKLIFYWISSFNVCASIAVKSVYISMHRKPHTLKVMKEENTSTTFKCKILTTVLPQLQ